MGKEIERKFLLGEGVSIPIPKKHKKMFIKQAYLLAQHGKQVRIRLVDKTAILGVKFTKKLIRDEYEYKIPYFEGLELYNKCELQLEKNRLSFYSNGEKFDIDSYPNGITFVEVEFKNEKALKNWVKPSWLGKEITKDKKFSNIRFAKEKLRFK